MRPYNKLHAAIRRVVWDLETILNIPNSQLVTVRGPLVVPA